MSNELDTLSAGDIAPYNPGVPTLSPISSTPDTWSNNDLLREDYRRQPYLQLFGANLPAGTTQQHVEVMMGQLGGVFMADFSSLGYPQTYINAAVQFMTANATKAPYHVRQLHNFNLHGQDDYLGHAFGNMVQGLSGSPRAKQQFVTACLQWLARASKQLSQNPAEGSGDMPRTATFSSDPTDDLSDAQWALVVKANDDAKTRTYTYLQDLWGDSFQSNLRMVDAYFTSLPMREQQALDQFTTGWIRALNTKEIILGLYQQAIGIHSMPTSGGAVATEIAQCEHVMKVDRKRWLADERLQARYRELLRIRSGG